MSFRNKFKVKTDIKKQIEKEDANASNKNPFLIPYHKLEDGQKLKILFVPFVDGELWKRFSLHGPNLDLRGIEPVGCIRENHGDNDCPVCQKGFDIYASRGKDKDTKEYKQLSAEARRWMPKGYTYMAAVVMDSPFEIPDSPDDNQVKLISVPAAVEEIIRNQIAEGEITPDTISETPFFIKKVIGENNRAGYKTSYFSRKAVSDEELEYFDDDDLVVEPIDASEDKYKLSYNDAPMEELEEWLETTEEKDAQKKRTKRTNKGEEESGDEETPARTRKTATKSNSDDDDDPEDQPNDSDDGDVEQEEKEDKPAPKDKKLSLQEKLAAAKAKKAKNAE